MIEAVPEAKPSVNEPSAPGVRSDQPSFVRYWGCAHSLHHNTLNIPAFFPSKAGCRRGWEEVFNAYT